MVAKELLEGPRIASRVTPLLGLVAGAFAGLTFSVTTLVQHNGFEKKSPRLTLINAGYQLMLFVVMGLVLGLV